MIVTGFEMHIRVVSDDQCEIETQADERCFRYRDDAATVRIRIVTSFISADQALVTLNRELPLVRTHDDVAASAKQTWNR